MELRELERNPSALEGNLSRSSTSHDSVNAAAASIWLNAWLCLPDVMTLAVR